MKIRIKSLLPKETILKKTKKSTNILISRSEYSLCETLFLALKMCRKIKNMRSRWLCF